MLAIAVDYAIDIDSANQSSEIPLSSFAVDRVFKEYK